MDFGDQYTITDCLTILSAMLEKEITLICVRDDITLTSKYCNACTPAELFSIVKKIEKQIHSIRIQKALQARKEKGLSCGRPKGAGHSKLDANLCEIQLMLFHGATQRAIASKFKTTPANLHNWIKKNKLDNSSLLKKYAQVSKEYKKTMFECIKLLDYIPKNQS